MKKTPVLYLLLTGLFSATSLHAQFFKKLLDNAKQTVQNRANSKSDQATNKALDKADSTISGHPATGSSGTTGKGGGNSGQGAQTDTGSPNRGLGAFAGAAAANPNDTPAADLTMKALGRLVGGGGVSAADSAAAIKHFMTAKGGSGIYYETITIITVPGKTPAKDTARMYFTSEGEGRSEMRIPMPGVSTGLMVIIAHADQPTYSLSLYDDSKSYSLNVIDTALINSNIESYQVARIGNETIGGYSCIHVRLTSTSGAGKFKSSSAMDLWTSTAVPGYDLYKRLLSFQRSTPKMLTALRQAGCDGFIIKMASSDKSYSMTMQLDRAERKSMPASLFRIPDGYRESQENFISHMASGAR